jgi:hypothetical protein
MVMIDMNTFYKTITDSVSNYIMFIVLLFIVYLLCVASVKILCDNIARVILAVRTPIIKHDVTKETEKN